MFYASYVLGKGAFEENYRIYINLQVLFYASLKQGRRKDSVFREKERHPEQLTVVQEYNKSKSCSDFNSRLQTLQTFVFVSNLID